MRATAALLLFAIGFSSVATAQDAGPSPQAAPAAPPPATIGTAAPSGAPGQALSAPPQETPFFAADVAAGKLPPVAERLPKTPRVIDLKAMGREPGVPSGTWRMLMGDQRDLRMMTIYSYARLVTIDEKLNFTPDILQSFEDQDDKVFTFHLREGHKWSDGKPFTAEDLEFFWKGVANNARLNPSGPPASMIAGGKSPKFEVLDPLTVRYTWDSPNPGFLPALAGPQPLFIFMPAHYLKQFHPDYADKAKLDKLVADAKVQDWGALFERRSRQYRPENPKLPTLDPWRNTTSPPAEQFSFQRNAYFHRVDAEGHQLPYIDTVQMVLGTTSLIPAKTASGESQLQARYLNFEDYTFLKAAEAIHNYQARLWQQGFGSYAALLPNLNCKDQAWRQLLRDVRFRRALSLGVNRTDINKVIFFGLARESADTVLPQSPLFKPEYASAYSTYDPAAANKLLDEIGLTKRDRDGTRLMPDGRRLEITIESSGEDVTYADIMELVVSDWAKLGIRTFEHTSHLDIFRKRITNGETVMSIYRGLDNGLPTAEFEPDGLAPVSDSQYEWPLFGLNYQSGGREGEKVDMPDVQRLLDLYHEWRRSETVDDQRRIWGEMLQLRAEQVYSIGIVNGTRQPVVVSNTLHNVPATGVYAFAPTAFFGIYMPDTFWFDPPAKS